MFVKLRTEKPACLCQAMYAVEMRCKHDALECFVRKETVNTKPTTVPFKRTKRFRVKLQLLSLYSVVWPQIHWISMWLTGQRGHLPDSDGYSQGIK